jgi:tape measure domain-containing protein
LFGMGFGGGEVFTTYVSISGEGGYIGSLNRMASAWGNVERAQGSASRMQGAQQVAGDLGLSLGGGMAVRELVNIGRESTLAYVAVERVRGGLITMLGSASAADAKIRELQAFAAKTPFTFESSAKGAQRLLAMGVAADDLIPTMRAAGDAVSAAGGDTETFDRVLLAIGQIQTKGRIMGQEMLQLTEAGIPATRILQRELGLTAEQVRNIGEEGIDASKALPALLRGMREDYGGQMDRMSRTTGGKISNAGDALFRAKSVIGEDLKPVVDAGAEAVTNLATAFEQLDPRMRKVIEYGVIGGVAIGTLVAAYKSYMGVMTLVRGAQTLTTVSQDKLTESVGRDIVAEQIKTKVAYAEAAAYNVVAASATRAALAQGALATTTALALPSGMAALPAAASIPALMGPGGIASAAGAGAGASAGGFSGFAGGIAGMAGIFGWRRVIEMYMTRAFRSPGFRVGGGAVVGAMAQNAVQSDMAALGYDGTRLGGAVGLTALFASAANPVTIPAVLAGLAVRKGINTFYNEPRERQAQGLFLDESGNATDERSRKVAAGDYQARANELWRLTRETARRWDGNAEDNEAEYQSRLISAISAGREARRQAVIAKAEAERRRLEIGLQAFAKSEAKRTGVYVDEQGFMRPNGPVDMESFAITTSKNRGADNALKAEMGYVVKGGERSAPVVKAQVTPRRDDGTRIEIVVPPGAASALNREAMQAVMTPSAMSY